jgi:hypothetical protein
MRLFGGEVRGTYGAQQTECTVFVYEDWYVIKGSVNVNHCYGLIDELRSGSSRILNYETLPDDDCATASEPIESVEELVAFIDE